jgi:hypothetical protein
VKFDAKVARIVVCVQLERGSYKYCTYTSRYFMISSMVYVGVQHIHVSNKNITSM